MKNKLLNIKGKIFSLERPVVMGILNVTPDSFVVGSRRQNESEIHKRIETVIEEGAAMIDVGGYSTRPGASEITPEEEWRRLEPALNILMKNYTAIPSSIDTFRADLAKRAVEEYSVSFINDISGGVFDEKMYETVAEIQVPYIQTHFSETSHTMQQFRFPEYVISYFAEKLQILRCMGVNDVIIDPGFGFNKTLIQNYELMQNFDNFSLLLDCPLMVGISRKSMIYKALDCTVEESLNGTTVLNAYSLLHGADILRVHDVKEAVEIVKLIERIIKVC